MNLEFLIRNAISYGTNIKTFVMDRNKHTSGIFIKKNPDFEPGSTFVVVNSENLSLVSYKKFLTKNPKCTTTSNLFCVIQLWTVVLM